MNFDHITNWTLKAGSHEFPGPDGGTCVNEAAIVAAGFEYRKIGLADDCPPCFSRPIAAYAIELNDRMPDDLRNELLMPFVMRLAGTADSQDIERQRVEFMVIQTVRRILPISLRAAKLEARAVACEAVTTLEEASSAAAASHAAYAAAAAYAHNAAAYAATAAYDADYAAYAAYAAAKATAAAATAAAAYAAKRQVFTIAREILSGAIELGKQGDALAVEVAVDRLNAARAASLEGVA